MTSEVETNIVAVERIKEYGETPQVILNKILFIYLIIYIYLFLFFRKHLGKYQQICHPKNGQQMEKFNLKILKFVIVKD